MEEEEKIDQTFLYTIDVNKLNIGFSERDSRMNVLENKGDFKIEIISNDGNYLNMRLLIDLKNLFSFQLPKMPKEYITRLVFNLNHESMVIINNSGKLIGGICFRVFKEQKFTEIAFLAVSSSQQGYGTRLLNHFKNFVIGKESNYLLTYADNYAIGFFKKQGFSKEIKVPFCLWNGVIKHYDGGIFMGCDLNVKIDYCQISQEIKLQKKIIREKIMEICINKLRFSGLQFSDEKVKSIESIPGINQSGWILEDNNNNNEETSQNTNIQLLCQRIVHLLLKNRHAWPFIQPVNLEEVPDYYTIIKNPIDLKSIECKVQNHKYENIHDFIGDINRIFTNARLYNQVETVFVKNANLLENFIKPYLEELMEKKL